MPFRFRFRLIPFVAATVAVVIGCLLGQWQLHRAADKEAIEAKLSMRATAPMLVLDARSTDLQDVEYHRIPVKGEFIRDWPVYLENRPYKGVPGFYVLMPLRLAESGTHLLVQRGWTPRAVSDRTKLPVIATPAGIVTVEGVARNAPGAVMQLGQATPVHAGAIVQNVGIRELANSSQLAFLPFVIEQTNDTQDQLVRDWPRPSSGVDKHLGYAFQWFALAATAFIFFVVTGLRRERQ